MLSWKLLCSSELLHCAGRVLCVASNLKAAIFIDAVDFTTGATLCFFANNAKNPGVRKFSEAEDLATGDKICQIWGCRKTNKGETLINMGSEVDLPSDCMFEWDCIHTVPHIYQGGTLYNGRLNMSNMQIWGCRKTNKGETLINMGSEVHLPSGCMFERDCTRTVPHIQRGGTFYIGRLNMSSMQIWGCR